MSIRFLPALFLCFIFNSGSGFAQDSLRVDSLQKELKRLTSGENVNAGLQDSAVVWTLFHLSLAYSGPDPAKGMKYARNALSLAEKIGYKRGIGFASNSIGLYYMNSGDYEQADKYLKDGLKARIEVGRKLGIAQSYGNIAILYDLRGNQPEALRYQLKAHKLFTEIGDKDGIAFCLNNIGIIYEIQKKYPLAIKYYKEAIAIREELGQIKEKGFAQANLANVYLAQGNLEESERYNRMVMEGLDKDNDLYELSNCYHALANINLARKKYEEALKYDFEAARLKEKIGNYDELESSYSTIGYIYILQHKLKEATVYLNKALKLALTIPSHELRMNCYQNLALLDSAKGNYAQALGHFKTYVLYRDSLINSQNTEKILQQQLEYEYNTKEALLKAEQDKKDKIAEAALLAHKKERILYIVLGLFLLLAVIALWSRLNLARKTRKLVEEKNEQIRKEREIAEQERSRAELMDMRHKIARDLHDDIGSSLSSIAIYSEVAQKITNDKMPEASKILSNVGVIAHDAMENMSDIVWTINPVNDKLDDIMQRLQIISSQLKEAKNITVHFDVSDNIREVRLNMHQRKNVYLIFKEAINNIAKYSGASNCYVLITKNDEQILISIKDDGKGFGQQGDSLGGNGLINMNKRAKEMQGTLEVISELNRGTEIKFQF